MIIKIVSIDSDGNEREIGTASRVDFKRKTFPDPDAYQYPFILSPPKVYEERIVLQDFSGVPDPSLYGGIYRELRKENSELREQLEQTEENFNHNLEQIREKYREKLSNQQRGFEENVAGQEKARNLKKQAEEALAEARRMNGRTSHLESVIDEQADEISELQDDLSAAKSNASYWRESRDFWFDGFRVEEAKAEELEAQLEASSAPAVNVRAYEERIESLERSAKNWREAYELADERAYSATRRLRHLEQGVDRFVDGTAESARIFNQAAEEWNEAFA